MGVVIRQSFWGTLIAYLGVTVGYVNTLYLRPEFFSLDQIGLFTLVTANAMMLSPLSGFGMNGSYVKFYPLIKRDEKLKSQFFTFQVLLVLLANLVVLSIAYMAKDWIASQFAENSPEYINYLTITGIIVIVNSLFDQLFAYSSAHLKVVFPSFLREVLLRIGAIVLVVGYAAGLFDFSWAVKGLAINYLVVLALLLIQLMFFQKLRFSMSLSLIDKEWRGKIFSFSIHIMSLAVTFAILNNASYNQISAMMGDAYNGIFVTCFFIGVIVEMPRRNMARVISPLLSESMAKADFKETESLYKKSSITMTSIGALLLIGIMTNLSDLFAFIPKGSEFEQGFGVVLAVCSAKLVLMASSFAGEIINYSDHFKYNQIFQAAAAAILIVLNYILIPVFGLNGVAISYFVAILLHSLAKNLFVYMKFRMNPLEVSHLKLLLISTVVLAAFYYFDTSGHPVITILLRSILTTAVFVILIYRFKVSEDINRLLEGLLKRFFSQ